MYSITTFLVGLDEKGEKCVGAKLSEGNRQTAPGPNYSILYLASSKGLTLCNVGGLPGWHKLLQAGRRLARTNRFFEDQEV